MSRRRRRPQRSSAELRRVGLFGPFGWGNLGDAAIQEAVIHHVRLRLPEVELVGVSLNPENTQEIHGIPALSIFPERRAHSGSREGPGVPQSPAPGTLAFRLRARSRRIRGARRLVRTIRGCREAVRDGLQAVRFVPEMLSSLRDLDLLVVSGGGQISDEWGSAWHHPLAMLRWVAGARLTQTRVYVVSVGAGPILRPLSARLFRLALRLAHYRSYRDEESRHLLRSFAFTRADPVYPDLAFALPVGSAGDRRDPDPRAPVIGLSPMSFCHPAVGAWPVHDAARYSRYRETIAEVGRRALSSGFSLRVFTSQVRNDRHAFDDLVSLLSGRDGAAGGGRLLLEPTADLPQLLDQIARSDVVIASRLHGVILAYVLHKPVVALAYDPKIAAVMRQFGQSAYCLDIESATADLVEERLHTLLQSLEDVRATIRATALSHRARLEEQFDMLFGAPPEPARLHAQLDHLLDSSLAASPPMEH